MADMSKFKEFPAQTENRKQWVLDVVRTNQNKVQQLFYWMDSGNWLFAKQTLRDMHKMDRDALLQPDGILTDKQIDALKE